jgi:DNA-directed RNA polymerase specialized sigma subunit
MPTREQRDSLLRYENEYSDDSVDLLKFDDFTLGLLGITSKNSSLFLEKESYFELLDTVFEYFIMNVDVWNIIKQTIKFHEKHGTYPNTIGIIIAHHMGGEEQKEEVQQLLQDIFMEMRPNSAERDLNILQMRIGGATLDEIGKSVDLTRERVRQILVKISPDLVRTIEALRFGIHKKQEKINEKKYADLFEKYGAIYKSELALELGVDEETALQSTPKRFNKFIIDKFPEPVVSLAWTREDCLNALRRAGTYYFPIRQADYDHLLNIGEIKGPSIQYMYLKFGQWTELCMEAGVECVPSVRSEYVRMWSDEELLSYARRFLKEEGTSGSYGGYDAWRGLQPDHVPSGVLIRNVFGNWTTVKRKVLEGLRLEKGLDVRSDL